MSARRSTGAEVTAGDRARGTLVVGGPAARRAARVPAACSSPGQALAWLTYAASRWYQPWSWFKIGLARRCRASACRSTASAAESVFHGPGATRQAIVATGALTIAVLVLAYRAGREQARAFERRPGAAALAGAAIAPGVAAPDARRSRSR